LKTSTSAAVTRHHEEFRLEMESQRTTRCGRGSLNSFIYYTVLYLFCKKKYASIYNVKIMIGCNCMPFALLLWEFKRGNKWDCDPKGTGQECHIDKFCPLK